MSQVLDTADMNCLAIPTSTGTDASLQNRYKAAVEHARRLSAIYEKGQVEIALAWETVAELEKAQRHRQLPRLSHFERYCLENPDAPEARIYDV